MKRTCTLLLFLAVASSAAGQEPADKTDKLLGTWRPTAGELSGQKVPDAVLKATQMVLGKGTYVVTVGDVVDQGTWKVDATTDPKNLDIVGTDGPNKGKTLLAIYRFDGDRLTVCYDLLGKQRPGAFETRQTQPYYLVTYERKSE